ncbi:MULTISPECIES: FUSC family protein [Winogradskyella]|jgi:predicted PurR-regulated permease PerM|uniref:FUSC family protein n=1 Tax=Winogradskyella TaxID=286104 RepID=UPI000C5CE3E4|nr:FUSC family protein [Winogradskyella sp. MH6]MAB49023.1 FUSC family protein [Flavobacteriaceae bacterium]MBD10414.1 FUSC family protein [Flavobacteriaceae bacterium]|tara:strand:- start:214 stop:552 length:339 start_codon:yes stop_codon:yes gene_type:complete
MGKKLIIFLGFTTAILAVILAVTPFSNLAVIPIVVAFICGLLIVFMSKKDKTKPKSIQYIFLMVIIALGITIYKSVYYTSEVGNTEQLEQRDEENLEDSKELLEDIDFDEDL